jgi:hypothetical protein
MYIYKYLYRCREPWLSWLSNTEHWFNLGKTLQGLYRPTQLISSQATVAFGMIIRAENVKDKGHKMESCLTWHECNIEDYISHYEV